MGQISVAETAKRLDVGVARVHQRIADGSLPAIRIGSQWVIDEASLSSVAESNIPGRPLSRRSAWALIAASLEDQHSIELLAPTERSRAKDRLRRLLAQSSPEAPLSEDSVHAMASLLRSWMRNRAERRLYRASPRDLPDLRDDDRVALSGLSDARSGIASGDLVEGYIGIVDVAVAIDDYLLSPVGADQDANVILHVVFSDTHDSIDDIAPLQLAADLAEHRRPREEARAAELLREIATEHPELIASEPRPHSQHRKAQP